MSHFKCHFRDCLWKPQCHQIWSPPHLHIHRQFQQTVSKPPPKRGGIHSFAGTLEVSNHTPLHCSQRKCTLTKAVFDVNKRGRTKICSEHTKQKPSFLKMRGRERRLLSSKGCVGSNCWGRKNTQIHTKQTSGGLSGVERNHHAPRLLSQNLLSSTAGWRTTPVWPSPSVRSSPKRGFIVCSDHLSERRAWNVTAESPAWKENMTGDGGAWLQKWGPALRHFKQEVKNYVRKGLGLFYSIWWWIEKQQRWWF